VATTVSVGGGNHNIAVFGNGTVLAGSGNDTISISGKGYVKAGSGNDSISVGKSGQIFVGGGHDTISLAGSGTITQTGLKGFDTINIGSGSDTIFEAGHATVSGAFGKASISGGAVSFLGLGEEDALSGQVTLIGGSSSNEFVGGAGSTVMKGGHGPDTFVGGSGYDTMTGGTSGNVFEFLSTAKGGQHVISNFASGKDQLYLEGHTLSYLQSHHDVTVSGGNTYISLDGGKTSIELKGITHLSNSDITTHKP
jgi:Ca2+-binding RTX toxin-like protein